MVVAGDVHFRNDNPFVVLVCVPRLCPRRVYFRELAGQADLAKLQVQREGAGVRARRLASAPLTKAATWPLPIWSRWPEMSREWRHDASNTTLQTTIALNFMPACTLVGQYNFQREARNTEKLFWQGGQCQGHVQFFMESVSEKVHFVYSIRFATGRRGNSGTSRNVYGLQCGQ